MIARKGSEGIELYDSFYYKDLIKDIAGAKWNAAKKVWIIPSTIEAINAVKKEAVYIEDSIIDEYNKLLEQRYSIEKEKASDNEPIQWMPIKVKPYRHQVKGYNIGCIVLGVI